MNENNNEDVRLSTSFTITPFIPFLSLEPNIQTILAWLYPRPPILPMHRLWFRSTDDMTTFTVDVSHEAQLLPRDMNQPMAIILPGTGQDATSLPTLRLLHTLIPNGFKAIVLNYRSCESSSKKNDATLKLMHPGFTDDLLEVLNQIREFSNEHEQKQNIFLCGFSMGGNIICNLLINLKHEARKHYNIIAAAVASVPFDMPGCAKYLSSGLRGLFYGRTLASYVKHAVHSAIRAGAQVPDTMNLERVDKMKNMDDVTTHYAVPVFGFKDALHCYQSIDIKDRLHHIQIPTLILNAKDDPFFHHKYDPNALPIQNKISNPLVKLVYTTSGGHCAFLDDHTIKNDQKRGYFQREFANWFSIFLSSHSN